MRAYRTNIRSGWYLCLWDLAMCAFDKAHGADKSMLGSKPRLTSAPQAKQQKQQQMVVDLTAQMAAKKAVEAAEQEAKRQERAAVLAEAAAAEAEDLAAAAAARAAMQAVRADRQEQVPRMQPAWNWSPSDNHWLVHFASGVGPLPCGWLLVSICCETASRANSKTACIRLWVCYAPSCTSRYCAQGACDTASAKVTKVGPLSQRF